jgi:hypothetical protein
LKLFICKHTYSEIKDLDYKVSKFNNSLNQLEMFIIAMPDKLTKAFLAFYARLVLKIVLNEFE